MILVDIFVPSADREYDFGLNEHTKISAVVEEVVSVICQKEQCELKGNASELLLCSVQEHMILPPDKSLEECGVENGSRLLLV